MRRFTCAIRTCIGSQRHRPVQLAQQLQLFRHQLVSYDADAYVYLDNVEWRAQNHNLTPGGYGYETLLHELGHALGLKHPFDDSIHLPASQDNTNNTLMSYTPAGGAHSTYSQYDVAALNWLYGGDGLGGALGINSTTGARYITGTSGADTLTGTAANDKLEGDGGNDMIDGGSGTDTAVFRGVRSNYTISALANGDLRWPARTAATAPIRCTRSRSCSSRT
jgi:serralysin